jgi:hypothetical protein
MSKLAERLRKYEALGPLPCLSIHPATPGYTTADVLGDTRAAIEALDACERALRDAVELFDVDPRHPMLAHALVRQSELLAKLGAAR